MWNERRRDQKGFGPGTDGESKLLNPLQKCVGGSKKGEGLSKKALWKKETDSA